MQSSDIRFAKDDARVKTVSKYINPLPRSVVRSGAFELLDGEWHFELDAENTGLRDRWFLGHNWDGRTTWPSAIERNMTPPRTGRADSLQVDILVGWYEREFSVPSDWLAQSGSMVQLTFGACGYETRVWLNGHLLKTIEGEAAHVGEYTSFSYELPPELILPVNRLTIRTEDSLDAEITRGKQESRVYKRGGIWYQTISGPVRSVWIEPVKRNRLRSRLEVISTIEDRLVEFLFTTRVHDAGLYNLRLVVTELQSNSVVSVSDFVLHLQGGEKKQRLVAEIPGGQLWSPMSPNLYLVTAQLTTPDGSISQIETHFGLRKIEARGRKIYLNNEAIYLDGILYQPGTSTFEQICRHFHSMKELGCNLVRVHIAGIDPRIYDLADEIGMLLWVEVPSPHSSTQRSRDNHWAELMRLLVIVSSHPSVVICSLYNEDWGVQDIAFNALTREYISRTYAYLRTTHPQVLVVDNDGWRHVSTAGRIESHLLTAHVYTPDLDEWREKLDMLAAGETEGVTAERLLVGDPFFYNGQVPLVVSEWGGFGFSNYGGPGEADPAVRAERIREFKRELRMRAVAGDVYTQATSIEDEVNGLINPETGELLVPPGILRSAATDSPAGAQTP